MVRSVIKTVLVIGEDHESIIKKYSLDTEVEKTFYCKKTDASKMRKSHMEFLEDILETNKIELTQNQKENYKKLYLNIKEMSEDDYFYYITQGCTYDENEEVAYSTKNPDAHYSAEKCYDKRLKKTGEEAVFSNPFKLKDDTLAYSARKSEIEWEKMHKYNMDAYKVTWQLVVENKEPENDFEKQIKNRMFNRLSYFTDNFDSMEDYVSYSTSYWNYGIATDTGYIEMNDKVGIKDWIKNFYDEYIKPLSDDTLLTIYEVKNLNDNSITIDGKTIRYTY